MLGSKSTKDWRLKSKPQNANAQTISTPGSQGLRDLWQPDQGKPKAAPLSFEQRISNHANLTTEQLAQAQSVHKRSPRKRLGQVLLEMGLVKEDQLLKCLAEQYKLPFVRIDSHMVDKKALALLDKAFIESHNAIPYAFKDNRLVLGTSDPTNIFLQDEIQRKTGKKLIVTVCTATDIRSILDSFDDNKPNIEVEDIIQNMDEQDVEVVDNEEEDLSDLEQAAGDSPIIKFVNYIIVNAVNEKASDIHIEPGDKKLQVRFRIDGILFNSVNPPHTMHAAVVSRIKIMANLDIAERRVPQDGRIRVVINNRNIDMRVSTLPTSHGEKVVMRILDGGTLSLSLKELGMASDTLEVLDRQKKKPHGIILVTGPTGSGKSTTLYAALRSLDRQKLNISTVEDPVEYQLEGVTQVQVHDKIGMSFSAALRSLLRQDPDVIMVGEIRDQETARIAIQASLTGHMVLSTLHTNDAPSSVTRLINIGVEPYLIAASTNAILAQRLVRKICQECKEPYVPDAEHAGFLEMYGFSKDNMFMGKGCDHCRHTGYQGRIGIYELLSIDDTYRDIITKNPTVTELRRLCRERSMVTLRDYGFRKVQEGLTSIDEIMRVTEGTV